MVVLQGEDEVRETWSYETNSLENLPNINNCITIENFLLSNIKLDTLYIVVLGTTKTSYRTDFCITKKNENYIIQDYDFKNDKCVDKELSFWEKLKSFFNKVFSFLF